MAIDFVNKKKKQQHLLIFAIIIIAIAFLILWFGYFGKQGDSVTAEYIDTVVVKRAINIKYDVLKDEFFERLQPFEKISEYEGDFGRDNPFLPR